MNRLFNLTRNTALQGAVLPLLLLVLWEFASRHGTAYAYAFVPVEQLLRGLLELLQTGELLINLSATLRTMLIGLGIGSALGLAVGGLMGVSRTVDLVVGPLYHTIRQVPLLGLIPLIGLWFGNGDFSKILIVTMAAFYPMVLNTYEGVRNVEKRYVEVAKVLKFSRWQLFWRVLFPGALPSIWTGMMHALAFAWISTVGSELLFAAGPGLGGMMQNAQSISRMDIVVIGVASIGLTGLLLNAGFSRLRKYSLRWRESR